MTNHDSVPLFVLDAVSIAYQTEAGSVPILEHAKFELHSGDRVAIVGPSGVGKTTLLKLLGALIYPDEGQIHFRGQEISKMSQTKRAKLRLDAYSFIYQDYNLIPNLNAYDNIALQAIYKGNFSDERLNAIVERLNLTDRLTHLPHQLSGGEQQRVAIARSMLAEPDVLFADEPSGSIDPSLSDEIMSLISEETDRLGGALVFVTHNLDLVNLPIKW